MADTQEGAQVLERRYPVCTKKLEAHLWIVDMEFAVGCEKREIHPRADKKPSTLLFINQKCGNTRIT